MIKLLRKPQFLRFPPSSFWLMVLLSGYPLSHTTQAQNTTENTQTSNATLRTILVTDDNDEVLENVSLKNSRTGMFATTSSNGIATIDAQIGDKIGIYCVGTFLKEISIKDISERVILSSQNPAVARIKPIRGLFNQSLKSELSTGSSQAIYNKDIQKMPATSILNTLVGRLAGTSTFQFSGQPGSDGISFGLRGQGPLVIIDGIPRQLTIFDLEEIESITVHKDALSNAMLGVRGNGGALVINTRKGSASNAKMSFTAQTAIQQPLKFPKGLDAYNYAKLYNEARVNDGLTPVYTDAALQAYATNSDPYNYPNVNWRDATLEPSSRMDRYTFSATGGNNFSKYFISFDHINQTGLLKKNTTTPYNTNNNFKSYTIRSNVDLQLNSKLSGGIYLLGRILNGNDAGAGTSNILNSILNTPNNAYPVYNPNGSYGGNQQFQNNILAQTIGSGYQQNFKRDMLADFYLKRTLDEIASGMWIKAVGSYYATLSENVVRNKTFAVFQRNVSATGQESYQQFGVNGDQSNYNYMDYQGRSDYLEVSLGYDKNKGNHGVNAVLLANRQNSVSGSDLPYTITGLAGRMGYNYKQKYILDLAFGLNGSNRYPTGGTTKYGFFPAVGLAWNISKEDFLQSQAWISYLKLYASYGKNGNDNPGYFSYIQRYFDNTGAVFGTGAGGNTGVTEEPLANPNITFEKSNKLNIGLTGALFDNSLGFTVEYYNMQYYDLLIQRGRNTSILGNIYPNENIGKNQYTGIDLQLNWQKSTSIGDFYATANAGFQNSKVIYIDEVTQPYSWLYRTGQRVGQLFGYISEGFYQTTAELQSRATTVGYQPQLGDLKYKDLNNDGVINQLDVAPIGPQSPYITFGSTLGYSRKGFDFSVLVQGVANRVIVANANSMLAFQNGGFGQAFEQHLDRWTPTNPNASYPRLWLGTNTNNQLVSTFWARSGDYVRLKNIELGYTLPSKLCKNIKVQGIRVFANATNLVTFNADKYLDPEGFSSTYPIQRVFNFGVNLKL